MRYYTYILLSQKNGDIYAGSTQNVQIRLSLHNQGRVKSTKGYRPWKLLEFTEFDNRDDAVIHERFLKNHQQKETLKKKYGLVAKR